MKPRYYSLKRGLARLLPKPMGSIKGFDPLLRLRRRLLTVCFTSNHGYSSQFGQDQFLDRMIFNASHSGVFLDIGAFDGVTISNSYFFEKVRGWHGMCIEPIPDIFEKLLRSRRAICIQGCAHTSAGELEFKLARKGNEMLSGRLSTFQQAEYERIGGITSERDDMHDLIRVKAYHLPSLLRTHRIGKVDFISIDTEGGELDLIKTLDLKQMGVRAVTIENNTGTSEIESYFDSVGFRLECLMGCDEIYRSYADLGL